MALLAIACAWAQTAGRRVTAITVDHGLNPESATWSRVCRQACDALGADWVERRWDGDKPSTGLLAAARRARHSLIAEAAREAGARVVLFGHTADDIAEADWMRSRGSTLGRLREWSPSPTWPEGRGLMLFRPMLDEPREALRDWLRAVGGVWIEDPGNAAHARGRARSELSGGAGPGDRAPPRPSSLSRQGDRLAAVRSSPLPLGEGFRSDAGIDAAALSASLLCASGRSDVPRGDRLERLSRRVASQLPFTATLCGARVESTGDRLMILREAGEFRRRPVPYRPLEPGRPAVWDGRYEITTDEPGWTVTAALGFLNALSPADRAIAATVSPPARPTLPVLIRDGATAPVLAWRHAEVRALAPRRLSLALGETTQESDLARTIHGETPPPDLF